LIGEPLYRFLAMVIVPAGFVLTPLITTSIRRRPLPLIPLDVDAVDAAVIRSRTRSVAFRRHGTEAR